MTGDGKLLKLTSLAALFVGLASLACGVVFVVGDLVDYDAWATLAEGALASVYGVRTAILANVPSNTSKIRGKAAVLLLAGVAALAFLLYSGQGVQVVQTCLAAVILALAAAALVLASRIVKEQLRK